MVKFDNKNDLRSIRTKNAIQTAFRNLMGKLPYNKITVTALTEAAGINRKTFYLHYETMDDLLEEMRCEILQTGIEQFVNLRFPEDLHTIVTLAFSHITALPRIDFQIIHCASAVLGEFGFVKQMETGVTYSPAFCKDDPAARHFALIFLVNTIGRFYYEWHRNRDIYSMEQTIDMTCRFLEHGLNT